MLTNSDYEKLLDFSMQLTNKDDYKVIEEKTLELLDYMFGFKLSAYTKFDEFNLNPKVTNIIGHNLHNNILDAYSNYYVNKDVFIESKYWIRAQENNYWHDINQKKIITIEDICSYDLYEETEYHKFLKQANVYYQMILKVDETSEVINIFKRREDGDFTFKERLITEKISQIINDKYSLLKKATDLTKTLNTLKTTTENMPFGLLVFDNHYNLVDYNKIGIEFSSNITNKFNVDNIMKELKKLVFENIIQSDDNKFIHDTTSYKYKFLKDYMVVVTSISRLTIDNVFKQFNLVYIYNTNWFEHSNDTKGFADQYDLTKREVEVYNLISKGLSNKEIADKLFISSHTVKSHIDNIFKKVGVNNRTSIIAKVNTPITIHRH